MLKIDHCIAFGYSENHSPKSIALSCIDGSNHDVNLDPTVYILHSLDVLNFLTIVEKINSQKTFRDIQDPTVLCQRVRPFLQVLIGFLLLHDPVALVVYLLFNLV